MDYNQLNKAIYIFDQKDQDEDIQKMFPFKDNYQGHTYHSWDSIHGMWHKIMEYSKKNKDDDTAGYFIHKWKKLAWKIDSVQAFELLGEYCIQYCISKNIKL